MAMPKPMNESSPSPLEMRDSDVEYKADGTVLEFPIAPGFDPKPPRLTPTQHLLWCEEQMRLDSRPQERSTPVLVEFVL